MGQYYRVVNLDKEEFINPMRFHDGNKLLEFGASGGGTMAGLAILLANSNDRGGGDLHSVVGREAVVERVAGRWAGDRIVIAGDYARTGDPGEEQEHILYDRCSDGYFTDISLLVIDALREDASCRESLLQRGVGEFVFS